ncbi:MAG: bifunctional riboflavin kinase/FAD synthetase [Verrucomicrobiota bacterium]|nr:bifunctional riboflavin kinase/FAD synthetase [Verrucomicrobiota bacterium]
MKIISSANELASPRGRVCLAIGMFDGVHLGHQQVLRQAVTDAQQHEATSLCVTFDQHPATVIAPERAPGLIQSLSQRLNAIETLGVDATLLLEFDEPMSRVTAPDFMHNLHRDLGEIKSLCVGAKFAFGHNREGNVELLKQLGQKLDFTVHGLASVALDGETISSSSIRQAIKAGDFDAANQMLGREHALAGKVVHGDGRGRELGFPTANLDITGLCIPPRGVYAAHVLVEGQTRRAAVNIGLRPTVEGTEPRLHVEAHILDFEGDLYGEDLEITFVKKLRDEEKFDSLEALKEGIAKDVDDVRKLFATL